MQTSVSLDMTPAFVGMLGPGLHEIISRVVSTQQLDLVAVDGDESDGEYEIYFDGTEEADFTASSNSATEIRDGLLSDLSSPTADVTAEASGTDSILIEAASEGVSFTTTLVSPSSDMSVTTLVAADQEIPFGIGVCRDDRASVSGQQCRLPRVAADVNTGAFLGITKADTMRESNSGNGYATQSAVSIVKKGPVWVRVEDSVVEGGDVFCRYTDPSANYGLGSFRSDADTSDAAQIPGAIYRTSASAGGLALVELNPTNIP